MFYKYNVYSVLYLHVDVFYILFARRHLSIFYFYILCLHVAILLHSILYSFLFYTLFYSILYLQVETSTWKKAVTQCSTSPLATMRSSITASKTRSGCMPSFQAKHLAVAAATTHVSWASHCREDTLSVLDGRLKHPGKAPCHRCIHHPLQHG